MITAIDTNILLDVLIPNVRHAPAAKRTLDAALAQGALVICEGVYAELAAQFTAPDELDGFLKETGIRLEHSSTAALHEASAAWKKYLKARRDPQCPQCGTPQRLSCAGCGEAIRFRQHILTDFLVGGHALARADRLLTRDLGYYRTYFKSLTLLDTR